MGAKFVFDTFFDFFNIFSVFFDTFFGILDIFSQDFSHFLRYV